MVYVADRVPERHPELTKEDVREAWGNSLMHMPRTDARPFEYMAVGFDGKGRAVEMLARRTESGDWVVWHAFTPPTKKAMRELGLWR